MQPKDYVVRVYVLKGTKIVGKDANGKSDPYLTVKLGKQKVSDMGVKKKHWDRDYPYEERYLDATNEPEFFRSYELTCKLPGSSTLDVQCWDHDTISFDDLIGHTSIDLEDRWFNQQWQKLGTKFQTDQRLALKPANLRTLWAPTSANPQGYLQMWVDILTPAQAKQYPRINIAKPPPEKFQLRVIVWKSKEVPNFDDMTDASDLYVKAWLEDPQVKGKLEKMKKLGKKLKSWVPNPFKNKEKAIKEKEALKAAEPQETDTHWRCRNGKGSWNWRMKFNVTLPHKFPYLHMQLWDRDVLKYVLLDSPFLYLWILMNTYIHTHTHISTLRYNDCIAECSLDCTKYFKTAHRYDEAVNFFAKKLSRKQRKKRKNPKRVNNPKVKSADEIAKDDAKDTVNIIKGYLGYSTTGDAQWLSMYKHNFETDKQDFMGKLLVSIEILPEKVYLGKPAGFGRSDPNMNPRLPAPVGRLRFSWNPFYMLMELLGPKICMRCACVILCVSVILLAVFGGPFLNVVFAWFEPYMGESWFWILVFIGVVLCCGCCFALELHAKYKDHLRELEQQARDAEEERLQRLEEARRLAEDDAIVHVDDEEEEKKEEEENDDDFETKNPLSDNGMGIGSSSGIELQEKKKKKKSSRKKSSEKSPLLATV